MYRAAVVSPTGLSKSSTTGSGCVAILHHRGWKRGQLCLLEEACHPAGDKARAIACGVAHASGNVHKNVVDVKLTQHLFAVIKFVGQVALLIRVDVLIIGHANGGIA